MRFRQIHLDFHTSECVSGIGEKFSKEQFQQMLKKGHVDSITVFSKCHHGWSYHPTKINKTHPELKFDLLKAQIEAAHEIDVKTPVYISAGYDEKSAVEHPEWVAHNRLGEGPKFVKPHYHLLCFNTPYLDKLLGEIKEVCENYDADGIFLDIVGVRRCYCDACLKTMRQRGLDHTNPKDVEKLGEEIYANYTRRVRETIDSVKPGLPVFHNGGHIRNGRRDLAFMNTHLELESLPTGGWGYDHFPMSAAYARTIGMDYLGMTGKFHKSWGEFGGYKHPNALRYEVALSAANGARCSIGDQLAPNGLMDNATYTLIGEGYKTLEEREEWLENAKNISDIAVLSCEAIMNYYPESDFDEAVMKGANAGCSRVLLEGHYLFDMIDTEADFYKYKLIILPDYCVLDDALTKKLMAYTQSGGKILATYKSGVDCDSDEFAFDFGCEYKGENEYNPSYIRPDFEIPCLANGAYVIYSNSANVTATDGESGGIIEKPYFNRSIKHFCSHRHTPTSSEKYCDAVVFKNNTAYVSYALFTEYFKMGNIYTKQILHYIIDKLIGDSVTVRSTLPAQGILTFTEDADKNRRMVHTLYASPVKRGADTEIIEDIIPIYDTKVTVKSDKVPESVRLVPENTAVEYKYENGEITFTVPKIDCWQITEIQY